jgi:hypothetical protein
MPMTHDYDMQSTESTDNQPVENATAVSRRRLLQYTAAGLVGLTGRGASETVSATETTQSSLDVDAMDDTPGSAKLLRVKGTGTGRNAYHIETTDAIVPTGGSDGPLGQVGETVIDGTVRKDHVDAYCFTGRITTVYARGSVTYYVSE